MQGPDVDLWSLRSLAQSKSLEALREYFLMEFADIKSKPWVDVSFRYLRIQLTTH